MFNSTPRQGTPLSTVCQYAIPRQQLVEMQKMQLQLLASVAKMQAWSVAIFAAEHMRVCGAELRICSSAIQFRHGRVSRAT